MKLSADEYETHRRKQLRKNKKLHRQSVKRVEIELSAKEYARLEEVAAGADGGKKGWITKPVLDALYPNKEK